MSFVSFCKPVGILFMPYWRAKFIKAPVRCPAEVVAEYFREAEESSDPFAKAFRKYGNIQLGGRIRLQKYNFCSVPRQSREVFPR